MHLNPRSRRTVELTVLAGLVSGALVLGIGGRILMRILAFTTPEPPRFTLLGSLQVVAVGTGWGAVTAPLLLLLDALRSRIGRGIGLVFGSGVLLLAAGALALILGLEGVVAPRAFLVLSAVLFPALFLLHGLTVETLVQRWSRRAAGR